MKYNIRLSYFTAIFTQQGTSPTIQGHGTIFGWDDSGLNVNLDFKIGRQPYHVDFKLTVKKSILWGPNAKDNKELALMIKKEIREEMNKLIKKRLEACFL